MFRERLGSDMARPAIKIILYCTSHIACIVFLYLTFLTIPTLSYGDDAVTIAAVGDIYLGGPAAAYIKKNGYLYPFESTKNILDSADIAIGNLEAPLTSRTTAFMKKEFILKHSPDAVRAIKTAGFDVLTLANNHIMDYGHDGLNDTITLLNKAGIKHTGAGENLKAARTPAIMNIKGKKIAFLAYSLVFPKEFYASNNSGGTARGAFEYVKSDIKDIRKHADIIIVSFHWGEELIKYPKGYQIKLARFTIDNGANLIIGHHPHVIQGIEKYKQGLILYSLGNFAFGSVSKSTADGMIGIVKFSHNKVISVEAIPLNVNNREVLFQPKPLKGEQFLTAIRNIQEISSGFLTKFATR